VERRQLKNESLKVRQLLKQIEALTYNIDQLDALVEFNQILEQLQEETLQKMPTREGLICRRKRDTTVVISRRRIKRARTIMQCSTLPPCKHSKQPSKTKQRVGVKAEKKVR